MGKRVAAIVVIFVFSTVAWAVLGGTIMARTYSAGNVLGPKVASTWGSPQTQSPPTASYIVVSYKEVESLEDGRKIVRKVEVKEERQLSLDASKIAADLELEPRKKGLLWYSTYKVAFASTYTFGALGNAERQEVTIRVPFPAAQALYDDLVVAVDGTPIDVTSETAVATQQGSPTAVAAVTGKTVILPGKPLVVDVRYRSQGLNTWRYDFGGGVPGSVAQVKDFELKMTTDFADIDFPDNTLSPSSKRRVGRGWELIWDYESLLSGYAIAMAMPEKLQPGPLAGRISFFAPVSLFFFFFVMLLITTLRRIDLHPVNYFFLAAAFFAFHLLLAYLVDHIDIHLAFAISSAVSLALVVSYLRLVVGVRFAAVEAGLTQFLYLVLFSYAFFFKGFTGLTITIGAILTLFVAMQLTGRIRWSERLASASASTSA
jgi:inner membrane protein involved in colicin E2 resistance